MGAKAVVQYWFCQGFVIKMSSNCVCSHLVGVVEGLLQRMLEWVAVVHYCSLHRGMYVLMFIPCVNIFQLEISPVETTVMLC